MRKAVSVLVAVVTIFSTVLSLSSGSAAAIPPPISLLIFPNGQTPGCYLYPGGHKGPDGWVLLHH